MSIQSWIENHPNATQLQRVEALAYSLIGTASEPHSSALECYGLPEGWTITDEPLETCLAFDDIVMRCCDCDWWCSSDELEDGICDSCRPANSKYEYE